MIKINDTQFAFAAEQIGKIDSGERNVFLEKVHTHDQIAAVIFSDKQMQGAFFSCMYCDRLRMHISFIEDTGRYNGEIIDLIRASLEKTGADAANVWIKNDNRIIIAAVKDAFKTVTDGKHDYASIEFIMRRENFTKRDIGSSVDIKPYEDGRLDDYLTLLDSAMTFASPPANFMGRRERYSKKFKELNDNQSFEAMWAGKNLIGLYWRNRAEIETIAVAPAFERMGYGSLLLSRAIERAFSGTQAAYAYLYVVDWNEKGQAFYKKFGMEKSGHSYGLRIQK